MRNRRTDENEMRVVCAAMPRWSARTIEICRRALIDGIRAQAIAQHEGISRQRVHAILRAYRDVAFKLSANVGYTQLVVQVPTHRLDEVCRVLEHHGIGIHISNKTFPP